MENKKVVFVGGGRITQITLEAWKKASIDPEVHVFDPQEAVGDKLTKGHPGLHFHTTMDSLPQADLLVLAVHPPVLASVCAVLAPSLGKKTLVVSFTPKIRLPQLKDLLQGHPRTVRMNPSAPSLVGQGLNPWAGEQDFPGGLVSLEGELQFWFAPLGELPQVEDGQIETYAVVNAMGPTYLMFQLQTLASLAQEWGISASESREMVARMVQGVGALVGHPEHPWNEISDLVPVRPLEEQEMTISGFYQEKLRVIHQRLSLQ